MYFTAKVASLISWLHGIGITSRIHLGSNRRGEDNASTKTSSASPSKRHPTWPRHRSSIRSSSSSPVRSCFGSRSMCQTSPISCLAGMFLCWCCGYLPHWSSVRLSKKITIIMIIIATIMIIIATWSSSPHPYFQDCTSDRLDQHWWYTITRWRFKNYRRAWMGRVL